MQECFSYQTFICSFFYFILCMMGEDRSRCLWQVLQNKIIWCSTTATEMLAAFVQRTLIAYLPGSTPLPPRGHRRTPPTHSPAPIVCSPGFGVPCTKCLPCRLYIQLCFTRVFLVLRVSVSVSGCLTERFLGAITTGSGHGGDLSSRIPT